MFVTKFLAVEFEVTLYNSEPHHCCDTAAAIFYSSKSRQDQGLVGLTSHGGPGSFKVIYLDRGIKFQDFNLKKKVLL